MNQMIIWSIKGQTGNYIYTTVYINNLYTFLQRPKRCPILIFQFTLMNNLNNKQISRQDLSALVEYGTKYREIESNY